MCGPLRRPRALGVLGSPVGLTLLGALRHLSGSLGASRECLWATVECSSGFLDRTAGLCAALQSLASVWPLQGVHGVSLFAVSGIFGAPWGLREPLLATGVGLCETSVRPV